MSSLLKEVMFVETFEQNIPVTFFFFFISEAAPQHHFVQLHNISETCFLLELYKNWVFKGSKTLTSTQPNFIYTVINPETQLI